MAFGEGNEHLAAGGNELEEIFPVLRFGLGGQAPFPSR
jgi:hypothetical protein